MIEKSDINHTDSSPLDQIRQSEAEVTRQIAAARRSAEKTVAQARRQANTLLEEARELGQREGKIRFDDIISQAEEMAHTIVAQAQHQAETLCQNGQHKMTDAVHQAMKIIVGNLDESTKGTKQ